MLNNAEMLPIAYPSSLPVNEFPVSAVSQDVNVMSYESERVFEKRTADAVQRLDS